MVAGLVMAGSPVTLAAGMAQTAAPAVDTAAGTAVAVTEVVAVISASALEKLPLA